jgi:hypothetical protein
MKYMGKSFRSDDLNQALLLPPSLHCVKGGAKVRHRGGVKGSQ